METVLAGGQVTLGLTEMVNSELRISSLVWSFHRQSLFRSVVNMSITNIAFVSSFASLPNVL